MNTFFKDFLYSGILFLRNGAASYEMESLSLCRTLSFKYCFNMIAKINTNKNYLDYFKNILLSVFLFFFHVQRNHGIIFITKWSFILHNGVILSFLLTFSLLIYY